MILIGHPWIESPSFYKVFSIDDIKSVPSTNIVLLEPLVESYTYAQYCDKNAIKYAVVVNTLEDAIYANALHASYMICEEDSALMIQPIAQEYLFDSKVLVLIHSTKDISKLARNSIDGVVFSQAIVG